MHRVILRENTGELAHQMPAHVDVVSNLNPVGFGENHNRSFEMAGLDDADWFVICNPDVTGTEDQLADLLGRAEAEGETLVAPLLWNNRTEQWDHNVRPRLSLWSLGLSFLGQSHHSRYAAEDTSDLQYAYWASGAFIAIRAGLFRKLGGFDERYFMYMEDVDLCDRARALDVRVRFYPDIRMFHNCAHANKSASNRKFRHHLRSVFRYFFI
ncbi:glycosyltransferase [Palleronia caenipelagi]|uniref:glycosyltransferase n=1 Tax=Palleronia caenipelagi TaxID=2489174 RepID=UPI001C8F3B9C|nr:glycosyltransferase family 2 protein [Palleronia caenipelagi]